MFRIALVLLLAATVPASAQSTNTTNGQPKENKGANTATTDGGQVKTISSGDMGSGRVKDKTAGREQISGTDLGSGRVKKEPKSN